MTVKPRNKIILALIIAASIWCAITTVRLHNEYLSEDIPEFDDAKPPATLGYGMSP
jgi:hypothetical protein